MIDQLYVIQTFYHVFIDVQAPDPVAVSGSRRGESGGLPGVHRNLPRLPPTGWSSKWSQATWLSKTAENVLQNVS